MHEQNFRSHLNWDYWTWQCLNIWFQMQLLAKDHRYINIIHIQSSAHQKGKKYGSIDQLKSQYRVFQRVLSVWSYCYTRKWPQAFCGFDHVDWNAFENVFSVKCASGISLAGLHWKDLHKKQEMPTSIFPAIFTLSLIDAEPYWSGIPQSIFALPEIYCRARPKVISFLHNKVQIIWVHFGLS